MNINETCTEIVNIIKDSAKKCDLVLKKEKKGRNRSEKTSKTWYNDSCREKRKVYNRARNRYLRVKTDLNKEDMQRPCKDYKKTLCKEVNKQRREFKKKIHEMRGNDPKSFVEINQQ